MTKNQTHNESQLGSSILDTDLFDKMDIPSWMKDRLLEMKYVKATQVQTMVIPVAIKGRDVLASSRTGSGKTVAFGVPIVIRLYNDKNSRCLILAPTRELASQIKGVITSISRGTNISVALLVGGEPISKQIKQLEKKSRVVVATPGRLIDHLKRSTIKLDEFNILVLDEFDRMLDMGFKESIANIVEKLPKSKQVLMFSATTRDSVMKLAYKYLKDHEEIIVGIPKEQAANIKQEFVHTTNDNKYSDLLKELEKRHGSIVIFVATKSGADKLVRYLTKDNISVDAIHGDLRQRKRDYVVKKFRQKEFDVLVATDVFARGIDVDHIMHVVNYDMPQSLEDYNHRIGRTGRGESTEGCSVSFICPHDRKRYQNIQLGLNSDEAEPVFLGNHKGRRGGNSNNERNTSNFKSRINNTRGRAFGGSYSGRNSSDNSRRDNDNNYNFGNKANSDKGFTDRKDKRFFGNKKGFSISKRNENAEHYSNTDSSFDNDSDNSYKHREFKKIRSFFGERGKSTVKKENNDTFNSPKKSSFDQKSQSFDHKKRTSEHKSKDSKSFGGFFNKRNASNGKKTKRAN